MELKIKATHPSQGDFVIIEADDFDPKIHQKYEEVAQKADAPKSTRTKKQSTDD